MSILIPLLLCIATIVMFYTTQKRKPEPKIVRLPVAPTENADEIESELATLRARREEVRSRLVRSGDVIELKNISVICEKGHRHSFNRFIRDASGAPSAYSLLDSRNLACYDHDGNYAGPSAFGRAAGEGLGWVNACFGCPTCQAQRFSFAMLRHNEYTTCGNHLVRKGLDECPLCAALEVSANDEMHLLARLSKVQFPQRKAS